MKSLHRIIFFRFVALAALFTGACFAADASKPNIVFIFADDWGWGDLSCHGHPYVKTPNIDRLAREGTDFQRFTVASGVCSPSRTAVMTGHFPARYNIDGHFAYVKNNAQRNMPDWLDPKTPTLPKMLQAAGYATAHFGKWHLSNDMVPDSPLPKVYGYDEYGAFNCAGEQMPVHEDAQHAIAFIEKSAAAKKPFFINLWMHEPHTPFHTVPKYEWRFRQLEKREDQIYASVLSHADDRIGEVLAALDRLKLADNTLVIFSSDNGPARGGANAKLDLQYDTATGAGWGVAASKGISTDSSHAELYDLQKDPLEKTDLSQSQSEVVTALRRKLDDWKFDAITSALNVVSVGERFIFSDALRGKGNVFDRDTGKVTFSILTNYACCRFTLSEPYVLGANMDMIDLSKDGKLVSTGPAIDSRECLGAVVSNGRIFYASQASGFIVSQTYGPDSATLPPAWEAR